MKIYNSTAFTLLEIIIASTVVGIIMLGIVTSNISLQKNSQDSSNSYFISSTTQTMLNQILKDASLAVGTPSSRGIAIGTGGTPSTGDANTFCIQQEAAPTSSVRFWKCYTWVQATYGVYSCTRASLGSCNSSNNFLGTAKTRIVPTFNIDPSSGNQKVLFDVIIENCLNPAAASCCNPSDPSCVPDSSNPYVIKEGSVSPYGHSAG